MKWFKHSVLASRTESLRVIREKYGYHALGVFWCIMEDVGRDNGAKTLDELERVYSSNYLSKRKIREVIRLSGCFAMDGKCVRIVDNVPLVCTSADTAADTAANTTANTAASTLNARAYINRDKENKEVEVDKGGEGGFPPLAEKRERKDWIAMLEREVGAYRDTICMKATGYGAVLKRRWLDALELFRQHITAKGMEAEKVDYQEMKSYFYYYVTSTTTRDHVRQYICDLEKEEREANATHDFMATYYGPELPPDAPPRPSDTAVFDFGSGEWVDR